MGSGSSKSRRRAISICSSQPLEPTSVSITDRTIKAAREPNKQDVLIDASAGRCLTDPGSKKSRQRAADPEIQLLDDILAESEDCWYWPQSTSIMPSPINSGSSPPAQRNEREKRELLHASNTVSSQRGDLQYRQQKQREGCGAMALMPGSVLDMENNNLLKSSSAFLAPPESSRPVSYDDVEEALMDSIEHEYTQVQPISIVPSDDA